MSYPICRHIMTNGDQCQSPRLREQDFCYFHNRMYIRHRALLDARPDSPIINTEGETIGWGQPIGFEHRRVPDLGPLEDRASVQMAIASVVNALLTSRIPRSRAATLLYGLQLASSNFPRTENDFRHAATDPVEEVETALDGTLLAPADRVPSAVAANHEERSAGEGTDEEEETELVPAIQASPDDLDTAGEENSPPSGVSPTSAFTVPEHGKRYTQVAMSLLDRRRFLSLAAAAVGAASIPDVAMAAPAQEFTFLHITDTHLQPELHGVVGTSMAFKKAHTLHADFAIQGGDHIFDGLAVPASRSTELYRLYDETSQSLSLKTYHAIGNHDLLGLNPKSGMNAADAGYGKAYFEQHIGPRYQSFDHKGVHFIVLDSIGMTPERSYYGFVDDAQMEWLKADLAKQSPTTPILITTHMPLASSFGLYMAPPAKPNAYNTLTVSNAWQIFPLLQGKNVIGVLQGHTHINERVEWNGVSYLTSGAVCGNWWQGVRMGTPEGFTVCTVKNGKLTTRYETYGFHADVQGAERGTTPSA